MLISLFLKHTQQLLALQYTTQFQLLFLIRKLVLYFVG